MVSLGDKGGPLRQRVTDLLTAVGAALGGLAQKARDAVEGAAGRVGIGSSSDSDGPAALPSGEKDTSSSGSASATKPPAKKAPAKKAPAKDAGLTKTEAAKTPAAKKAPAKKAPAKKAPAKKAPAKKAPAKKAVKRPDTPS